MHFCCRNCMRVKRRQYRKENKEKINIYLKEWRLKHKIETNEKQKTYNIKNQRRIKSKRKEWYSKNRGRIVENRKYDRQKRGKHINTLRRARAVYVKQRLFEHKNSKDFITNESHFPMCCYDFHHVNDKQKSQPLSSFTTIKSIEKAKIEADKCIMITAINHKLIHYGLSFNQIRHFHELKKPMIECEPETTTYRNKKWQIKQRLLNHYGWKCCDCNINYLPSFCLEFHHLDREAKDDMISRISNFDDAIKEAQKCVVLCTHCHRIRHFNEFH